MAEFSVVGKSTPRIDGWEKVTGKGQFCFDVKLPGMLRAKILRSPYPHARIVSIDTSKAEKLAGVRAVLSGKDIPDEKVGYILDRYIMARDVVRFVGEPVVAVAADTTDIAEEAIELIEVNYEELTAVFDPEEAIRTDPPVVIHPDLFEYPRLPLLISALFRFVPDRPNVVLHRPLRHGDVEKGFQEADLILESRFSAPAVHHCQMEPHSAMARVDSDRGMTVWATEQTSVRTKTDLCRIFGFSPAKLRFITPYLGGSFGGRVGIVPLPIVILLSLKTGRPVKAIYTRDEVFVDAMPRSPSIIYIKDGVKNDGTLVAREVKWILNVGAYSGRASMVVRNGPFGAVGSYRVPNFKLDCYGVYTNEPPNGPYRAFGTELIIWAIECHMDMIAEKLGIDSVEIIRKNILMEGDKDVTSVTTYNIGAMECLEKAAELIEWYKKPQPDTGPWKRGKGIALTNKYTLASAPAVVMVKVHEDATIELRHSVPEMGQGSTTVLAQIAAEEFGVSIDKITQLYDNTAYTPFDYGAICQRTTFYTGNALRLACQDAKRQLFEVAAPKLEMTPESLDTKGGKIFSKSSPEISMNISELYSFGGYLPQKGEIIGIGTFNCPVSKQDSDTGQGERVVAYYSHGACAVELAVNVETGAVKVLKMIETADMAQPINPKLCEGQIEGGMLMGIGEGLYEEMISDNGVVVNPTFMDYKLPSATEIPSVKDMRGIVLASAPHKEGPFGAKGGGEGPKSPVAPAIANAVYDAVRVRIKDLPLSREKIFNALKERVEQVEEH